MISYLLLLLLPFLYILPLALEEEEMSPNMGAWWYLLIEVFRDFQPYFILVLAVYPMFYVAPLAIRLQPSAPLLVSEWVSTYPASHSHSIRCVYLMARHP